jgi:NTE family protein
MTPRVPSKVRIGGVLDLTRGMGGTVMNFHDEMHIDPAVLARTMFVDTLHVKATDFDIGQGTRTPCARTDARQR